MSRRDRPLIINVNAYAENLFAHETRSVLRVQINFLLSPIGDLGNYSGISIPLRYLCKR